MLTMRMYAVYERSRKVLALCIGVGVVIVIVGCVSLNLRGNHTQSETPLLMLWYSGQYRVQNKINLETCKYTWDATRI